MTITSEELLRVTYREMSEKQFQQRVVDMARTTGWLTYHTYNSRRSEPGFPDLVMVHPTERRPVIFAELKRETGKVSMEQKRWINALRSAFELLDRHVVIEIWRPADLPRIQALLEGRANWRNIRQ